MFSFLIIIYQYFVVVIFLCLPIHLVHIYKITLFSTTIVYPRLTYIILYYIYIYIYII